MSDHVPDHEAPSAAADDSDDVEHAWAEEIQRRLAEVDAGTAELIPAEVVFAELRARSRDTPPREC